jgi:nucleoside-diphosphate-sugar epimerase
MAPPSPSMARMQGTRNVMSSVLRHKESVARVVLTSSCAAVKGMHPAPPQSGTTYNEADWNETSTVEGGEAYWVGKTQAERAAWEMAEQHGLDLVTVLPEFVMGPLLSSRMDGTSMGFMKVGFFLGGRGRSFQHVPVRCGWDFF